MVVEQIKEIVIGEIFLLLSTKYDKTYVIAGIYY